MKGGENMAKGTSTILFLIIGLAIGFLIGWLVFGEITQTGDAKAISGSTQQTLGYGRCGCCNNEKPCACSPGCGGTNCCELVPEFQPQPQTK